MPPKPRGAHDLPAMANAYTASLQRMNSAESTYSLVVTTQNESTNESFANSIFLR